MDLLGMLMPAALALEIGSGQPSFPSHDCLVENILHEARGEPLEGQLAVIEVVYTRAARSDFPDSVCTVIEQPYQFSWLNPGAVTGHVTERERTMALRLTYSYLYDDLPATGVAGATHYLNPDKVENLPDWYFEYQYLGKIGNHEFFKRPEFPWVRVAEAVPY